VRVDFVKKNVLKKNPLHPKGDAVGHQKFRSGGDGQGGKSKKDRRRVGGDERKNTQPPVEKKKRSLC